MGSLEVLLMASDLPELPNYPPGEAAREYAVFGLLSPHLSAYWRA